MFLTFSGFVFTVITIIHHCTSAQDVYNSTFSCIVNCSEEATSIQKPLHDSEISLHE